MDDSDTDMIFRPSPKYVGQCALAMNCDLQIKTQTRYSQKTESPPFKKKVAAITGPRLHGRLIGCAT
jgi:hypothetical protein